MSEKKPDINPQEIKLKPEDLRAFLEKVDSVDQSTLNRIHAESCYRELKARESSFIGSELEEDYYNALSLELMHIAQNNLLDLEGKEKESIALIEEAITAAKKGFSPEWTSYLEGTVFYLKNDPENVKKSISLAEENAPVLQKLYNGLISRGHPDYRLDY